MFERHQGGETAVLVHLTFPEDTDDDVTEFRELAVSSGADVKAVITGQRRVPDPRYFVGSGKAEEIRDIVKSHEADVVMFDHALSPAQERNLERLIECRVMDRTSLILDIFAQRARSFEGKLQVELAQLRHLSTRLVRGWTHLERQKGGIGLRGPGETQLETDRRLIGHRIKAIGRKLEKVQRQRAQGRRARKRAEIPTVTLVGYTNAGKSTLFNSLTNSGVYAADQLFATLDPTIRRVEAGDAGPIVLTDTVGFVRKLPHDLVAAFKSTLEETRESDLLLHIVDASDHEREDRIEQVNEVLDEIEASDVPQVLVFNKIDRTADEPRIDRNEDGKIWRIWLSAKDMVGLEALDDVFREFFGENWVQGLIHVPMSEGKFRAKLFELSAVKSESVSEDGEWILDIRIQAATLRQLMPSNAEFFHQKPTFDANTLATPDKEP